MVLVFGNGLYYRIEEKNLIFVATFRCIKYVILSVVIIGVTMALSGYMLETYKIDIMPFIGV